MFKFFQPKPKAPKAQEPPNPTVETFVHLQTHSEHSLMRSTCKVRELVERTKALGQPALALTDYGNLDGAHEFYREAQDVGIKPIFGMELYVEALADQKTVGHRPLHRMLLLAENNRGYDNLTGLAAVAKPDPIHGLPHVTPEVLLYHSGGLFISTGLEGEVAAAFSRGEYTRAREVAEFYLTLMLYPEHLLFNLNPYMPDTPAFRSVQHAMNDLAASLGAPVIATNDVSYMNPEDHALYDVVTLIGSQCTRRERGPQPDTTGRHFKSTDEMRSGMAKRVWGSPCDNNVAIAERCNVHLKPKPYAEPSVEISADQPVRRYTLSEAVQAVGKALDLDQSLINALAYQTEPSHIAAVYEHDTRDGRELMRLARRLAGKFCDSDGTVSIKGNIKSTAAQQQSRAMLLGA